MTRVKRTILIRVISVSLLTVLINICIQPTIVVAQSTSDLVDQPSRPFNPNFIITDFELTEANAMSVDAIRRFLLAKGGILGKFTTTDIDGVTRDAAEMIWRAAQAHQISPRFIITLLQKEQSLVENATPQQRDIDWATGFGVCDSCNTDDPALQPLRGFAIQVDRAAARNRYYLTNPNDFEIGVGRPRLIDTVFVAPVNQATANLYIYTPHLNGNRNFWAIWERYFGRRYPDGTLLKERDTDNVWLLTNGRLRLINSRTALSADYDTRKIISVPTTDILRYDIGLPISYPNYSLLRSPGGTVYLLVDDIRRGIASREVFRGLGFNPDEIIDVNWADLDYFREGTPITSSGAAPLGELWQDKTTGGVWYVANSMRYPIVTREILRSRYSRYSILAKSPEQISRLELGAPILFRDGELVTVSGNPTVYVISNGARRPISAADVFVSLGYRWDNIIYTSQAALVIHQLGEEIAG